MPFRVMGNSWGTDAAESVTAGVGHTGHLVVLDSLVGMRRVFKVRQRPNNLQVRSEFSQQASRIVGFGVCQ